MERKQTLLLIVIGLGIFLFSAFLILQFFGFFYREVPRGIPQTFLKNDNEPPEEEKAVEYAVEEVATGLSVPWSIVFTNPSRMLITEREGNIRLFENGELKKEPLYYFSEVVSNSEEGLMGLVIDPEYEVNKYIYTSLAYQKGNVLRVKVVRLRDNGDTLSDPVVIIDDIPAAQYHAGSRIKFGPDKKLYITTGDATDKGLPQDLASKGGKILRINADGTSPSDNPYPGNPVWSYGHRNPQGLAWHPVSHELYSTEHGPSLFDGPAGGDEVNRIIKGTNYGWPLVSHTKSLSGAKDPLLVFTPAEAPAGADFYDSPDIPQFQNQLFFGALKGEGLIRVEFDKNDPDKVKSYEKLSDVNVGRVREVVMGPDGALYFTTSNRDGRGKSVSSDDRIFRIRKK